MSNGAPPTPLREELGAAADPDFVLELPPGWERRTPDADDLAERERALKARLMKEQRPDLYLGVRTMLRESHGAMQREGVVAYYSATDPADSTLWIPGSMSVSILRPPSGGTLDQVVRHSITQYGAAPLFDDRRFIRFERQRTVKVQDGSVESSSIIYLTPIPGTKRRRALKITASFGRPLEMDADDPKVRAIRVLFDVCVSTLTWVPKAAKQSVGAPEPGVAHSRS